MMTLAVAIASENDAFDGELHRYLIGRVLSASVSRWVGPFGFGGCKSVAANAPAFLIAAQRAGVDRAVLAVDNDGGSLRRKEHVETHVPPPFDIDDDETCRECWITQAAPLEWREGGGRLAVVVPVQAIETWLLTLRGDALPPSPEQSYYRPGLKKRFFGKSKPSIGTCIKMAMAELERADAIDVLMSRPSFRRFSDRLRAWGC